MIQVIQEIGKMVSGVLRYSGDSSEGGRSCCLEYNAAGGPGDEQASPGGAQAAAGATSGAGETPSSPTPPLTP